MLTVAMLGTYGVYAEQSVDDTENLEEIEKEEILQEEKEAFEKYLQTTNRLAI